MKKSAEDGLRGNKSPDPEKKKTPSTKSDTGKKVLSAARLISPVDAIASAAESGAHLRRGNLKAAGVAALGVGVALGGGALISKARKAASTPLKKSGEEMLKRGKEFGSPAAADARRLQTHHNVASAAKPKAGTNYDYLKRGQSGQGLIRGTAPGVETSGAFFKRTHPMGDYGKNTIKESDRVLTRSNSPVVPMSDSAKRLEAEMKATLNRKKK